MHRSHLILRLRLCQRHYGLVVIFPRKRPLLIQLLAAVVDLLLGVIALFCRLQVVFGFLPFFGKRRRCFDAVISFRLLVRALTFNFCVIAAWFFGKSTASVRTTCRIGCLSAFAALTATSGSGSFSAREQEVSS